MENDTIAAISTPIGSGGIGIIKISGNNALSIATSIFKRSSNRIRNISTSDTETACAFFLAYRGVSKRIRKRLDSLRPSSSTLLVMKSLNLTCFITGT